MCEALDQLVLLSDPYIVDYTGWGPEIGEGEELGPGYEGAYAGFTATFADDDFDSITSVWITWPNESTPELFDNITGDSLEASHYVEEVDENPGAYAGVGFEIHDSDVGIGYDNRDLPITNGPPTATISSTGPVNEGGAVTITASDPQDPSPVDTTAGFRYAFSFDTTIGMPTTYNGTGTSTNYIWTHPYTDNVPYSTVYVRIFDEDNGYTQYAVNVVANNVAPTATIANSGPVLAGQTAEIYFTNPSDVSSDDVNAGFRYDFKVGDGSNLSTTYAVSQADSYTTFRSGVPGTYEVSGWILDKDNGHPSAYHTNVDVLIPLIGTAAGENKGPGLYANLAWEDLRTDEDKYVVERWNGSMWVTQDTFGAGATADPIMSGLSADTTYYFRVRAELSSATLATSNIVSITIPTYLSNLTPTNDPPTNGFGPVEIDMSNGENGSEDGTTISLAGVPYAKGLGAHANSDIIYDIGGGYTQFSADVGVDDEVGLESNNGSVIFKVYYNSSGTGSPAFSSGLMQGKSPTQSIFLDVTSVNDLKLVVEDNGANDNDHASWGNAMVKAPDDVPSAPTSPSAEPFSSSVVHVLWDDNSDDETGFEIDYSTSASFPGGGGTTTVTSGANTFDKEITGLDPGTIYYFRVHATNSAGDSDDSGTGVVATPLSYAPTALTVTSESTSSVSLSWTASSGTKLGYKIERADSDDNLDDGVLDFVVVGTVASNQTTFTDGVSSNKIYYYRVFAYGASGHSTPTEPQIAITYEASGGSKRVFNVDDYDSGGGEADEHALQDAIDASGAGDVILFEDREFAFSTNTAFELDDGNRKFVGRNATIVGEGPDGYVLKISEDGVTITGLSFEGGGIYLDTSTWTNTRILGNSFDMDNSGQHSSGITLRGPVEDFYILNNYFTSDDEFGIWQSNSTFDNLVIANNVFENVPKGIHIAADTVGGSSGLLIDENLATGTESMGFELQGPIDGVQVLDNDFVATANLAAESIAFSLPLNGSENIEIRRNRMVGNANVSLAFELGGGDSVPGIMEDNYAIDGWNVAGNTDADSGSTTIVRNNRYVDFGKGPVADHGTVISENNGPGVDLTWDINRAAPQQWVRYEWLNAPLAP